MKRYLVIIFIFLFTFSVRLSWAENAGGTKTIVVLPFDNLSGEAPPLDFTQALYDYLIREKLEVIPQEVLEQFFIKRRIRRISSVNQAIVRKLKRSLGADVLIIGSINVLSGGDNPQVDISAQVVDTVDSSIIWMNSVSFSGNDFATILGIGKIRSLEKLVEIAIKDLFKNMPDILEKSREKKRGMVPFEIVRASFYPKAVKGKQSVGLMIEVKEIVARPTYMNAIVHDKHIPLISDGDKWYRGSFISPPAEGSYALKLYAAANTNKVFFFEALASLIVDNTPPVVTMLSHSTLISPNNDGINDYAMFFPTSMKTDTFKGWRFEVRDKDGKLIRSAEDAGGLPRGLIWRGENNAFELVGDGTYFGQLIIEDNAGHKIATDKVMIMVDRTFPEVKITPGKTDKDVVTFNVESKDASKIVEWDIVIYNQHDEVLGTFRGTQNVPSTLRCTVKKKPPTPNLPIHLKSETPREIC